MLSTFVKKLVPALIVALSLGLLPVAAGAKEYLGWRTYLESVDLKTAWYPDFTYALSVMAVIYGPAGQNDFYCLKILSPLISGDDYQRGRFTTLVYWKQRRAVMLFTDDEAAWMASDAGIRRLYSQRLNLAKDGSGERQSALARNVAEIMPHLEGKWRRITITRTFPASKCVYDDGYFNAFCWAKLDRINEQRIEAEKENYRLRHPETAGFPERDPAFRYQLVREETEDPPPPPPFTKQYGASVRLVSSTTGGSFCHIEYEATLDNGTVISGRTNENGYALIEADTPGTIVDFKADRQIMFLYDEEIPESVPPLISVGLEKTPLDKNPAWRPEGANQ